MTRPFLLFTLLVATEAFALTSQSARLLTDEASAAAAPADEVKLTPIEPEPVEYGVQFAAGSVAALISVPGSLKLGEVLGTLSPNLYASAAIVLPIIGLLPPLVITLAEYIAGNWNTPGRYRFWPSFLVNLVVNGISLAVAANWGLSVEVIPRVVLYTIVQAVIQPAGTTLLMRAWPKGQETNAIISSHDPSSPTTFVVPTGSWSF